MFHNDSEIKYLWIFASNLETEEEMLNNSELRYHAKKVITILAKILVSLVDENAEKVDLVRLGRRHHGYGLLKDHFKVKKIRINLNFKNCKLLSFKVFRRLFHS